MIRQAVIDRILQSLDLPAFIGERVALARHSETYEGLCPFHTESSASFKVFLDLRQRSGRANSTDTHKRAHAAGARQLRFARTVGTASVVVTAGLRRLSPRPRNNANPSGIAGSDPGLHKPCRVMKKLITALPEYEFVMHHQLGPDEHVVIVKKDGAYAVCKMQPRRSIAMSPNYQVGGYGLLTAPLTPPGLTELLQWADFNEATSRFRNLAGLPANVSSLLREKRPPG